MNQPSLDHVRDALRTLTLDQMADSLDALCEQAGKDQWVYLTFLARLLDEERAARETRRLVMKTKLAHFPFQNTLEQFDFGFQPGVEKRRIQDLASLRVVANGDNVLF